MNLLKAALISTFLLATGGLNVGAQNLQPKTGIHWNLVKRSTYAINYVDSEYSTATMMSVLLDTKVTGRVEGKRLNGQTQVKIWLNNLPHPQLLGVNYTSYVVWAILPEGLADNMGRLSISQDHTAETIITTPHQTFGLVVTAEPHPMVKYPGPKIVAENLLDQLQKEAKGRITQRIIEYRGDSGIFY